MEEFLHSKAIYDVKKSIEDLADQALTFYLRNVSALARGIRPYGDEIMALKSGNESEECGGFE